MPAEVDGRRLAQIAIDYETSGQAMRKVGARHGVSAATVQRGVMLGRHAAGQFATARAFSLQQHFADVLVESAEAQREAIQILRTLLARTDFVDRLSGRDIAAIVGTLARENRATFDYVRRTFGVPDGAERAHDGEPPNLDLYER